ncbi:MAG: cytochrome C [Thiotrichales bacterium]|nr:MAG: cytochrome C [Thiotrichales bacterium]PCI12330.1 MAG: cytochrome C [Thiotrichales bacterium]
MIAALIGTTQAHAASDGNALLKERCASCHHLTGPAAQTAEEAWKRQAPGLFYAGVKYKGDWLETWLTKPTRLRPMGYHYFKYIKTSPKGDLIDRDSLLNHPALTAAESKKATAALLKLTASPVELTQDEFNGKPISISFGEMVFGKFNGCIGCHPIEPGYGGLSGPERL